MHTAVVIGAGASFEFGLPTGRELKSRIATLLDLRFEDGFRLTSGDPTIAEAFKTLARNEGRRDWNDHFRAAHLIRDALPPAPSIDNFLHSHRADKAVELAGKLAIVKAILDAERDSKIFYSFQESHLLNLATVEDTWINSFFGLVTEDCDADSVGERLASMTLIVFNYDRCIQHYFLSALQRYYGFNEQRSADLVRSMNIFHPYGSVGSLPSLHVTGRGTSFGADPSAAGLLELASGLKTFTEGVDPEASEIQSIRAAIRDADRLLFLGFAFHPINMRLLNPGETKSRATKLFATGFGLSNSDRNVIEDDVIANVAQGLAQRHVALNTTCAQLFPEFARSLSFAH